MGACCARRRGLPAVAAGGAGAAACSAGSAGAAATGAGAEIAAERGQIRLRFLSSLGQRVFYRVVADAVQIGRLGFRGGGRARASADDARRGAALAKSGELHLFERAPRGGYERLWRLLLPVLNTRLCSTSLEARNLPKRCSIHGNYQECCTACT